MDFARAIYYKQVMTNLTREGSNLASRGTDLGTTATAVMGESAPLDLNKKGRVIVTSVLNNSGAYQITGQVSQGGISASSRIGTGVGNPAKVPTANPTIPQPGQTAYITEVFYSYQPMTPIGKMVKLVIPSTLYDAAYF